MGLVPDFERKDFKKIGGVVLIFYSSQYVILGLQNLIPGSPYLPEVLAAQNPIAAIIAGAVLIGLSFQWGIRGGRKK